VLAGAADRDVGDGHTSGRRVGPGSAVKVAWEK
jgi:hypothetical protein